MEHRDNIARLNLVENGRSPGEHGALALERALDSMAADDIAATPAGLTDRVFMATREKLGPPVAGRLTAPHISSTRRLRALTPLRAAAMLALTATVALSILAERSSRHTVAKAESAGPELEAYVEWWASGTGGLGSELAAQASALDQESAALRDALSTGTGAYDLWAEEGAL